MTRGNGRFRGIRIRNIEARSLVFTDSRTPPDAGEFEIKELDPDSPDVRHVAMTNYAN
jgi:hypothetical protein